MPLFLFGTSFVALLCSAFLFSLIFISVELYSRLIAILLECVFFNPLEPEEVKLGLLQKLRSHPNGALHADSLATRLHAVAVRPSEGCY